MIRLLAALLMAGSIALPAAVGAQAHEGGEGEETLAVEPASVTAGERVILAGSGLEPDSDRVLVLAGPHVTIHLTTVRTDADGMFNQELEIPIHLPSGIYELQAIGDETLTASLGVTAAAGLAAPPTVGSEEPIVARARGPGEWGLLIVVVGFLALAGVVLAFRVDAERATPAP